MAILRRILRVRSWPLAVKMSVELVFAALIPLVLAMFIVTSQSRTQLAKQGADDMELLAEMTAARLDQLLVDTNRVASILSSDELIRRFCAADATERAQLKPAVDRKIEQIVGSSPDFASILIDDHRGVCIAATSDDMVGVDYNFREYFRRARAGDRYISAMLVGKTSRVPGVYFSAPVYDPSVNNTPSSAAVAPAQNISGESDQSESTKAADDHSAVLDSIKGVVVLKLDGHSIWTMIDSVKVGGSGYAMLSNADGIVTAHPNKDLLYRSFAPLSPEKLASIDTVNNWNVTTVGSLDLPELMPALTAAPSRGTQWFTKVQEQGGGARERWIAGFAALRAQDWVVSIVQPMREFDQPIAAMLRQQVWVALAVALLAVAAALVLARRTVRPVLALTKAANELAHGDFAVRAPKTSDDEIGQLAQAFNDMVPQLKERVDMQQSLKVAMEVQQSLLPASDPTPPGLDVAGRSRYCDATGGDYFDFVDISHISDSTTLIALGDVMGHGVASALLMATARAALRSLALDNGSLAHLIGKVNTVLAADARHGRFMTMSLMIVDPMAGTVRWVCAGHDPIIVFHATSNSFEELGGGDLPLGVDAGTQYEEYTRDGLCDGDLLFIGTDGIWELRNDEGEMYGKQRLRDFIKSHHHQPAAKLAAALEAELRVFSGDGNVQDDVTFVVARVNLHNAAISHNYDEQTTSRQQRPNALSSFAPVH